MIQLNLVRRVITLWALHLALALTVGFLFQNSDLALQSYITITIFVIKGALHILKEICFFVISGIGFP